MRVYPFSSFFSGVKSPVIEIFNPSGEETGVKKRRLANESIISSRKIIII